MKNFIKVERRSGFQIIELITIVAIIAVLSSIIFVAATKWIRKSKISVLVQDLETIKRAVLTYHKDVSRWPPLFNLNPGRGVTALFNEVCASGVAPGDGLPDRNFWRGAYIERVKRYHPFSTLNYTTACQPPNSAYGLLCGTVFGGGTAVHLRARGIPQDVAQKVDEVIDGGDGFSTGYIRWSNATSILFYIVKSVSACSGAYW